MGKRAVQTEVEVVSLAAAAVKTVAVKAVAVLGGVMVVRLQALIAARWLQ